MDNNDVTVVLGKESIYVFTEILDLFPCRNVMVGDTHVNHLVVKEFSNLSPVGLLCQVIHSVMACAWRGKGSYRGVRL